MTTTTSPSADLTRLRDTLHTHLHRHVLPFWLQHAVDPAGRLNTCLRDDGTLISRDKWLWSQWRAVWLFAKLHEQQPDDPRWRPLARHVFRFCAAHGWVGEARGWALRVGADGRPDVGWDFADRKLWWPHTEALYATLLAHTIIGEPWARRWYDRVHDYAFARFPSGHGEWVQKLDRLGRPFDEVVALPVKDPFHLPRALLLLIELLDHALGR